MIYCLCYVWVCKLHFFSCSGVWFGILGFVSYCNVVSFLKTMPMFVCFNNLVIFLILGLWWVNVFHNFLSFSSVWVRSILCYIWRFNFCGRFCGKLLFLSIVCISSHSFCFFSGASGWEYVPEMWYLKAAILCYTGWFERKLIVVWWWLFFCICQFRYLFVCLLLSRQDSL